MSTLAVSTAAVKSAVVGLSNQPVWTAYWNYSRKSYS